MKWWPRVSSSPLSHVTTQPGQLQSFRFQKIGNVRVCADFKITVNPYLQEDQCSPPRAEDVFAPLAGGDRFTMLDMSEAFAQINVGEASSQALVINTHKGLFRYYSVTIRNCLGTTDPPEANGSLDTCSSEDRSAGRRLSSLPERSRPHPLRGWNRVSCRSNSGRPKWRRVRSLHILIPNYRWSYSATHGHTG